MGHHLRIFAVRASVAPDDNSFRTKPLSHPHGHARIDAVGARLVAAGGYYAPAAGTTYQYGPVVQAGVKQAFYRHEESVQVDMYDGAIHFFSILLFVCTLFCYSLCETLRLLCGTLRNSFISRCIFTKTTKRTACACPFLVFYFSFNIFYLVRENGLGQDKPTPTPSKEGNGDVFQFKIHHLVVFRLLILHS